MSSEPSRRGRQSALAALAFFVLVPSAWAQSNQPVEGFWITDGDVLAIRESGGTVYVGGNFDFVGPYTGPFMRSDAVTGAPSLSTPLVARPGTSAPIVYAVAADGEGGFYIGGDFTRVGGLTRNNIARILADGRVSAWNPNVSGPVYDLAVSGGTIYAGGAFGSVGGQARTRLAAIDAVTGAPLTTFTPTANNSVFELVLFANTLYLGGAFTQVNASTRNRIAALDAGTGATLAWNPSINDGTLLAIAVSNDGTTVYAGGTFTNLNTAPVVTRNNLAAINAATGIATSWNPNPNNGVLSLAVGTSVVYAGGVFTSIGGASRNSAAALQTSTGNATSWNPNPNSDVYTIAASGSTVYLGGFFRSVGGSLRGRVAAVNDTTGALLSWNSHVSGGGPGTLVREIALSGNSIGIGGELASVGGIVRTNLAAFDATSGAATSFSPGPNDVVRSLAVSGSRVYAGGDFITMGGQFRSRIAAIDASSGAVLSWNPDANATVRSLVVSGGTVYAGGDFTLIGGQSRNRIAALDSAVDTNNATTWNPGAGATVRALAVSGNIVYAGGDFVTIGGQSRNRIAALDATIDVNNATAWDPNASSGSVNSIDLSGSGATVYLGGTFFQVGAPIRNRIAAVDASSGLTTAWNPDSNSAVNAVAVGGTTVFAGGTFTSMGVASRDRVAALDALVDTSNALPWNPGASLGGATVDALTVGGGKVFVGGSFASIGSTWRRSFAAFCLTPTAPTGLVAAPAGAGRIDLSWTTTGAPSYNLYRSRTSGGPYLLIGSSATPSYSDNTVDGGVTYYYVVRAGGSCESDLSTQASATATGVCSLPPDFEGAVWVEQPAGATCSLRVHWAPGAAPCGGALTYSVYRSTSPSFTPLASNQIAHSLSATSYVDSVALPPGQTFYYVVRALQDTNPWQDQNLIVSSGTTGTGCTASPPPPVLFFNARSSDGANTLHWVNPVAGYSRTRIVFRTDTFPSSPSDGAILHDDFGPPGERQDLPHGSLGNGTTYFYAAYVADGGGIFSGRAKTWARPDVTSTGVHWGYTTGAAALTTAGVIPQSSYFANSNDNVLNRMGEGTTGGSWPLGPPDWVPFSTSLPAQGRPLVVKLPTTRVAGRDWIAIVGSQDGRVHAVDARTGERLWVSPILGSSVQPAPSAMFRDFGGDYDLVLVGTWEGAGDSKFYALRLENGTVAWTFDNGGGATGIGPISGQAAVDYDTNRVYFASREKIGGSNHTLWCLSFTDSTRTWEWSKPLGNIDGAPTLRDTTVYVGNIAGEVYAHEKTLGTALWGSPWATGDGAVKGFVWPDRASQRLYFSTDTLVHAIQDDGGSASTFWTAPVPISGPSALLVILGRVFVGGGDSRLYSIDATSMTPGAPTSVLVGDPLIPKSVGPSTYDLLRNLLIVGTEQGAFYAVTPP